MIDRHKLADLEAVLGRLTVTQGRRAGERFTVLPWQRRFLRGAFCGDAEASALSVARGNGKTTLLAGVAVCALIGPLRVLRGETVLVASSFEQARIAFEHIHAFMLPVLTGEKSGDWRVWDTAQQARIEHRPSMVRVRCIGSDPRRAHGLAPVLVLADEPAQWPTNTGEAMVSALRTAAGKQPFSRFVALGTRPADEMHWFSKMLAGGADYAQLHAARPEDPRWRKRTWAKANPSLRHMPDLETTIRKEAAQAKMDPALLASLEALRLNLGTADTEQSHLLDAGLWREIEGPAPAEGEPVWGIDLGTSAAQSAVVAYWPETGRLEGLAAFPCEPGLAERGLRDGVGNLYRQCADRNELLTLGQRSVDISALIRAAAGRWGRPYLVSADRWREAELRDALDAAGIYTGLDMRGQGYKDGAEDVRSFRRACADGDVRPVVSLLLRSAMQEARTVSDPAGNAKLAKATEGGRRARARDDSAAAAILAVAAGRRVAASPRSRGVYLGMV